MLRAISRLATILFRLVTINCLNWFLTDLPYFSPRFNDNQLRHTDECDVTEENEMDDENLNLTFATAHPSLFYYLHSLWNPVNKSRARKLRTAIFLQFRGLRGDRGT